MFRFSIYIFIITLLFLFSCKQSDEHSASDGNPSNSKTLYTCSMHPQIIREKPGNCPICGMVLVKMEGGGSATNDDTLSFILKPANEQVLLKIPVIRPQIRNIQPEFTYAGVVSYIPQQAGVIAARFTGRIEKIFVKYNYQAVTKGQKLFEIYSPEILTEQQNLLFLLRDDPSNRTMIEAARNKLQLLGLHPADLAAIEKAGQPVNAISVYSNFDGFVTNYQTEKGTVSMTEGTPATADELAIKAGSYVQKGQALLQVINTSKLWALISVPVLDLAFIKPGTKVRIKPESNPDNDFRGEISYIEPILDAGKKKANARVVFSNSEHNLPIGSQLKALVFAETLSGTWLPKEAIINLGREKAVLLKEGIGFKVKTIVAGDDVNGMVRIVSGISAHDEVAANAQYIMDSESFIKEF